MLFLRIHTRFRFQAHEGQVVQVELHHQAERPPLCENAVLRFDKKTHVGELVVNKALAKAVTAIFRDLYKAKYPIEKMRLIDDYDADDNASMAANNTSSFNFRHVEGSKALSQHAYGRAIDINPRYNPYIVTIDGKRKVEPPNGQKYADRSIDLPYIIHKNDVCYKAFANRASPGAEAGGPIRIISISPRKK